MSAALVLGRCLRRASVVRCGASTERTSAHFQWLPLPRQCPSGTPAFGSSRIELREPQLPVSNSRFQLAAAIASPAPTARPSVAPVLWMSEAKAFAISAPQPDYPYEARFRHITGSGVCVISVDVGSGSVTNATMAQSIGNPILDNSTVSAFRRWRFKPGTVSKVKVPITYTMTGVLY